MSTFKYVPARQKIQIGQVWKKDGSGDSFLVTKIYNEALTTFAVLRKTGSETEPPMRVKVAHTGGQIGQTFPASPTHRNPTISRPWRNPRGIRQSTVPPKVCIPDSAKLD